MKTIECPLFSTPPIEIQEGDIVKDIFTGTYFNIENCSKDSCSNERNRCYFLFSEEKCPTNPCCKQKNTDILFIKMT